MNKEELLIEAILFAAGTRISVSRIMELAKVQDRPLVESVLTILQEKYSQPNSAFELTNMGEDWKLTVKKQFLPVVEKIAPDAELPKSIIETLAMLAWKAPMTQSELVRIRSNKAYDHIAELKDRGFIVKEKTGRTYVIKLTPKFYEYFDIEKEKVDSMMEKFKDAEKVVPQKKVTEFEKKEEPPSVHIEHTIEEQETIKQIKEKDRETQREFFEKIEQNLQTISQKATQAKADIHEIAPPAQPEAIPPTNEETQPQAQDKPSQPL